MQQITKPQIQKIHILLRQLDAMDEKQKIVSSFTKGRTESTREMTYNEAKALIIRLCEYEPSERLKSAINQLAYKCGLVYGDTEADKKMNKAKIDMFCRERGTVKKDLNKQTYPELVKTHRQFEAMLKNKAKANDKKQAAAAVNDLLKELDLTTTLN